MIYSWQRMAEEEHILNIEEHIEEQILSIQTVENNAR